MQGQGKRTALTMLYSMIILNWVELLLQYGADPNAKDDQNRTPLDLAKLYKYRKIENLLKKQ